MQNPDCQTFYVNRTSGPCAQSAQYENEKCVQSIGIWKDTALEVRTKRSYLTTLRSDNLISSFTEVLASSTV